MTNPELMIFIFLNLPVIYYSRLNLFKPRSHGFYRFLSWECITWLFSKNFLYWFKNPFGIFQIISWLLLILSIVFVVLGITSLKTRGAANRGRDDSELHRFEKTTRLVTTGIYRFIRHPLYGSLMVLIWGIYCKNPQLDLTIVALIASIFLFITAKIEERENLIYFGDQYKKYMRNSKRFIPFVF